MAKYFEQADRSWVEMHAGVRFCALHRYEHGGGAGLFQLDAGASIPEHAHPTGEHGYVIEGVGQFGDRRLVAGDAFWLEPGETHAITATTALTFFGTSLPQAR